MTMSNREPTFGSECDRFAAALAAMVDEALDPHDRRRVDAHLAGCEACRALLADLRAIRSLAATLEPIEVPAWVWHDVRRRVARMLSRRLPAMSPSGSIPAEGWRTPSPPAPETAATSSGLDTQGTPAWSMG